MSITNQELVLTFARIRSAALLPFLLLTAPVLMGIGQCALPASTPAPSSQAQAAPTPPPSPVIGPPSVTVPQNQLAPLGAQVKTFMTKIQAQAWTDCETFFVNNPTYFPFMNAASPTGAPTARGRAKPTLRAAVDATSAVIPAAPVTPPLASYPATLTNMMSKSAMGYCWHATAFQRNTYRDAATNQASAERYSDLDVQVPPGFMAYALFAKKDPGLAGSLDCNRPPSPTLGFSQTAVISGIFNTLRSSLINAIQEGLPGIYWFLGESIAEVKVPYHDAFHQDVAESHLGIDAFIAREGDATFRTKFQITSGKLGLVAVIPPGPGSQALNIEDLKRLATDRFAAVSASDPSVSWNDALRVTVWEATGLLITAGAYEDDPTTLSQPLEDSLNYYREGLFMQSVPFFLDSASRDTATGVAPDGYKWPWFPHTIFLNDAEIESLAEMQTSFPAFNVVAPVPGFVRLYTRFNLLNSHLVHMHPEGLCHPNIVSQYPQGPYCN